MGLPTSGPLRCFLVTLRRVISQHRLGWVTVSIYGTEIFSQRKCGYSATHCPLWRAVKMWQKKMKITMRMFLFVNKPGLCIWLLGTGWAAVSSGKGWLHEMLIKMMRGVLAEWDTAWRFLWIRLQAKYVLWPFYHWVSSNIWAAFLFVMTVTTQFMSDKRKKKIAQLEDLW